MRQLLLMLLTLLSTGEMAGAVIHVRPKLVAVLTADGYPVNPSAIVNVEPMNAVSLKERTDGYTLLFDFLMTIEELTERQAGFGNVVFDIALADVEQSLLWPGWIPDVSWIDPPPGPIAGSIYKWADNLDAGRDGSDLKLILLGTFPRVFFANDPRRTLGIAPYLNPDRNVLGFPTIPHLEGEYAGSLLVSVPPGIVTQGEVRTTVLQGSTYSAELLLSADGTVGGPPATFRIEVVPEPCGACVLMIGVVCALPVVGLAVRSRKSQPS